MPRSLHVTVLLLSSLAAPAPADPPSGYPPAVTLAAVRERIDQAPRRHPRLFATAADFQALRGRLDRDPLLRLTADAVVARAEAVHGVPPVTRTLTGKRLLSQSRLCLQRVLVLAMAHHLTGDLRHVRRAAEEMTAAARFDDWNPDHFLDVAEMTCALAIGYDWLHDRLEAPVRDAVREAILRKGVSLPFASPRRWVRAANNWGQVCHGGLTLGALAVLEDAPDLAARTVHHALHNVTCAMSAYAPEGGYPEGPAYWAYGTTYNVLLIAAMESALGTDFGLSQAPGFDRTGRFPAVVTGPTGLFFSYADGGPVRAPEPCLHWLAGRAQRPEWLRGERELLRASLGALTTGDPEVSFNRFLPLTLLWMREDGGGGAPVPPPLNWHSGGETPVAVHRSGWSDPGATFLGLKAGSPSDSHGQMDAGSFVLESDGVRWAVDLGKEDYHAIESRGMDLWGDRQDSDRWTIFRLNNHGHNTLVIDGRLQHAAGRARIAAFSDDPARARSVADLSEVYSGQADSVRRGAALLPSRAVLLQDELTGLKPGSRVRWGMITQATPGEPGGAGILLRQGNARLRLECLAPEAARWRIIDTETPPNPWDSPNPGTRMAALEAVAPESGALRIAVRLIPGGADDGEPPPDLRPLREW